MWLISLSNDLSNVIVAISILFTEIACKVKHYFSNAALIYGKTLVPSAEMADNGLIGVVHQIVVEQELVAELTHLPDVAL